MAIQTPPVISGGLPVLGHTLEMLRNRSKLFKRGYQEQGDAFTIKLGPQYAVVVSGAEYNRLVYTETDKKLNMQEAYTFLKAAIGEVLFTAGKDTYDNQRPVLQEVFRRKRMVAYIQGMNIEVERWLDGLGIQGEIDISAEMLRLTQYVAAHALIGPDFRSELGEEFWPQYEAISRSLDPVLPPNLPLPKFIRRDRANFQIRKTFRDIIARRRENPDHYDDLISTLLTTPQKDGTIMDEETIVSIFTGLMFAGHETTAGQAAWLIALLLQHPAYLAKVQAEIDTHLPVGTDVTAEILHQLEHIFWAIDETTRLRPSADLQMRTTTDTLDMGPYQIPAGWRVIVNAANSHFLPATFTNPEAFDPLRYSPDRAEGKNPFAIVGFGGGVHKCTGMNFAKNEMAVIVARLLQQYHLHLLSQEIRIVTNAGANHPSEIRVRYWRKTP